MVYITYNMGTRDLPDIYARTLGLGIYIRQIPRAHVITITYIPGVYLWLNTVLHVLIVVQALI